LVNGTPLDDIRLDQIWVDIDDFFHFRPAKSILHTILLVEAHAAPCHPVREYLVSALENLGTVSGLKTESDVVRRF